jgi:AAA domain
VTGDHHDRDGIPLPSGPLEDAAGGGDVVTLQPGPARARPPALPAAELAISTYREVVARVAAAGEPRWLIQGLWPADAYGVLAAQEKAGRTWAALDLAVSVATGRPWLDHFLCPTPGPVLVFLGEGGNGPRCAGSRPSPPPKASTPISSPSGSGCASASLGWPPRRRTGRHPSRTRSAPAALVVLDPLYLAAAGASGSNLYDVGAVLQAIQGVCQQAGCALGVELIGGEIADTRFRIRRRVRADDPADLGAPLSYAVEVLAADEDVDLEPGAAALSKSRQWVLTALRAGGDLQTVKQLGDRLAQAGHPLKPRTIQTALAELEASSLAWGVRRATAEPATGPQSLPTAMPTIKELALLND